MARITKIERIKAVSVLFLDAATPKTDWNRLEIDGKKYKPIPIYDMKKAVAVDGNEFSVGQEVSFIFEH